MKQAVECEEDACATLCFCLVVVYGVHLICRDRYPVLDLSHPYGFCGEFYFHWSRNQSLLRVVELLRIAVCRIGNKIKLFQIAFLHEAFSLLSLVTSRSCAWNLKATWKFFIFLAPSTMPDLFRSPLLPHPPKYWESNQCLVLKTLKCKKANSEVLVL